MKAIIPISLKRLATAKMNQVQAGQMSRADAERMLKARLRHNSKLREDLIAGLTESYDAESAEAMKYFRLI